MTARAARRIVTARAARRVAGSIAVLAGVLGLVPAVAHACPMCFGGNNQNQDAFLWGSLFLMFVPVTAIGSLLYWAYRRSRALESGPRPTPPPGELPVREGLRVVR